MERHSQGLRGWDPSLLDGPSRPPTALHGGAVGGDDGMPGLKVQCSILQWH